MTIPDTMTAIAIAGFGGPEVLRPETRPVPQPKPGEILIRVAAAGVNRSDARIDLPSTDGVRTVRRYVPSRSRATRLVAT